MKKNKIQSQAELLSELNENEQKKFIKNLSAIECEDLIYDWRGFLARKEQLPPETDWDIWLVMAGRGFGKTRIGAEWVKEQVEINEVKKIAIIGETAADVRDVMIEGESGILQIYPENKKPNYEPSKRKITWENGAIAKIYNATEPDQLRGPQHEIAWCDEIAKWRYARETWDQLQFGLRTGKNPKQVITTTPRPIDLMREIIAGHEGKVEITYGKTSDNYANLAQSFIDKIERRYQGTRLGRQELNGEMLGDMPGALWTLDKFDVYRVREIPENLNRIVVAVDPAVSNNENSDEHGIIVVGIKENDGYVIKDASCKGTPLMWARCAIAMHDKYYADGIVVETNQGGDMVAQTIRSVRENINIIEVHASKGKHARAEPIAALYEQGRIHHTTNMQKLENQMIQMTAAGWKGEGSPDRVDALVWGFTNLFPELIQMSNKNKHTYKMRNVV